MSQKTCLALQAIWASGALVFSLACTDPEIRDAQSTCSTIKTLSNEPQSETENFVTTQGGFAMTLPRDEEYLISGLALKAAVTADTTVAVKIYSVGLTDGLAPSGSPEFTFSTVIPSNNNIAQQITIDFSTPFEAPIPAANREWAIALTNSGGGNLRVYEGYIADSHFQVRYSKSTDGSSWNSSTSTKAVAGIRLKLPCE